MFRKLLISGIQEEKLSDLQGLPFAKVQHEVSSLDAQPSNEAGGILVLVAGRLLVRRAKTAVKQGQQLTIHSTGRRGAETHELHPVLPTPSRRCRQLLRLQRHLQTRLRCRISDLISMWGKKGEEEDAHMSCNTGFFSMHTGHVADG